MASIKNLKNFIRMCSAHDDCEECPLRAEPFTYGDCATAISKHYQECVRRIDNWCKEHPVKTYAQDFFEKFPNAPKNRDGLPCMCMNQIYQTIQTCDGDCKFCWNLEYKEE